MRFFSVLSTMTLVASVMGAAIPAPVEENNIEVKRTIPWRADFYETPN